MSSILTNNSAMVALNTLKSVNASLSKTQDEISTGKTVATAKDNAAIWSISKVMESDVKGFKTISESLALGQSTVAVGREAAETVTDLLTDMKGKIVSAQEGNVDREKIQTDISALRDQIKSVVGAAQFNGLSLVEGTDDVNVLSSLDRSSDGTVDAKSISVARQDLTSSAGKFGSTALTGGDLTGLFSIENTSVTPSKAEITFTEGSGAGFAANETIDLDVGGQIVQVTLAGTEAATDVTDKFVTAITNAGIAGITATNNSGKLEISNATGATIALDIATTTMADGSSEITNLNGAPSSGATGTMNARTEAVSRADNELTSPEEGKAAKIAFKEGTNTGYAAGDTVNLTIGGSSFSLTLGGGEASSDLVNDLVADINARQIEGVTASNDSGELKINNANDFSDLEIGINSSLSDSGTAGIVELNGRSEGTISSGTVEQRAETIDFSSTARVAEGTGFQVGAFGNSFQYIAGKGETMDDVARGLKTAIDSGAPDGVETRLQVDKESGQVSLAVGYDDVDGTTQERLKLSASTGGEASGGLFGIDNLDVTTNQGATAALENIETLIQNSIDAAASFGSDQGRLSTQSSFVSSMTDALTSGIGALVDTDMEETSARLQALQVQQQLSTQALSIANQSPQSVLSLFR